MAFVTHNKGAKLAQVYRTTCKVCGHAICHGQPTVWSRQPLGLIHEQCLPHAAPS